LLEEILLPQLRAFTDARGLYLDAQGARHPARKGKKVAWEDKYGNTHDLDFVIEKEGSRDKLGRPVAFIEAAWRRYTKHSRNKAQEIQGAILPVAEKYEWDQPFLGSVLAGVFTEGSLTQMKSSGFDVLLFPYESIVKSFATVGIDAEFDEDTPDKLFAETVDKIEALSEQDREKLEKWLINDNRSALDSFLDSLGRALDRQIESVQVIPLSGTQYEFSSVDDATVFVNSFDEAKTDGQFRKYEILVKYSNGDRIDATFSDKEGATGFLLYVSS
jgi:hypothetical protein